MINADKLSRITTNKGDTLMELSNKQSVLLVFLRHFGCVFCREAMKDIAAKKALWKERNVRVVMVHMAENDIAEQYFQKYGLAGVSHVSNPSCSLYKEFGLSKGNIRQLFGLKNWVRGFEVTVAKQIPLGLQQIGDGFQMPGIFLIRNGEIQDSYIHNTASDKPNYDALIECCATT